MHLGYYTDSLREKCAKESSSLVHLAGRCTLHDSSTIVWCGLAGRNADVNVKNEAPYKHQVDVAYVIWSSQMSDPVYAVLSSTLVTQQSKYKDLYWKKVIFLT